MFFLVNLACGLFDGAVEFVFTKSTELFEGKARQVVEPPIVKARVEQPPCVVVVKVEDGDQNGARRALDQSRPVSTDALVKHVLADNFGFFAFKVAHMARSPHCKHDGGIVVDNILAVRRTCLEKRCHKVGKRIAVGFHAARIVEHARHGMLAQD